MADGVNSEDLASFGSLAVRDSGTLFAEQSHLAYCVPSTTNLNLEETFGSLENGQSFIDSIESRQSLFFEETVDVLLILKAPWLEEKALQAQLDRLVIQVDAQIVNGSTSSPGSPPISESIFSGTVPDVGDPFIVVDEEESDGEDEATSQFVYAIWQLPVCLSRPRLRLQNPSVVFTASASLKPDVATELTSGGKGYLSSGLPAGLNLLESFSNDPALRGIKPRLSALRVSRVAPVTRQEDLMQHIRAVQQIKFNIHPPIHSRIRFSRPNTSPPSSALIACLEIDFTSHFNCEIVIDGIKISVPDASIQSLNDNEAMKLPLSCVANDHLTFLYHITPTEHELTSKTSSRDLAISISASILLSEKSTPKLSMAWTTPIDFATIANPAFGQQPGTGIQRGHRPSQLSIGGSQAVTPLKSPSVTRPDALPALEAATTAPKEIALPDLGITISFTGPSQPVYVGDVFSWTVYVVNRSTAKTARPPRKLALVAVPRRRRNELRALRPLSFSGRREGEKELADAIVDDHTLYTMQKSSVVDSTEVVCLSADTRVGPLAPGACHVVELQFLALKEGIVGVEAIRVVDLGSQEHVDIRELPTTIIEPGTA